MRKQTIVTYEKEFMAWCRGEPVLVGCPASMSDASKGILTWRQVKDFKDWGALDTKYVLDNEYSTFSKALADGKVVEGFFNNHWTTMTEIKVLDQGWAVSVSQYRIKPDEPKFKVGDWVKYSDQELMSDYRGYYKVSTILNEDNIILEGLDGCNQSDELIKWKPQPGEWCWFWNDNDSIPTLNQFLKMDKTFTSSYAVKHVNNIRFPEIYSNCEPFVGTLPSNL